MTASLSPAPIDLLTHMYVSIIDEDSENPQAED